MLNIVLIDDEIFALRGMEHLIKKNYPECNVMAYFEDAREAVDYIEAHIDEVDIVLSDMNMPTMTGLEVIEHLKKLNPDIFIVVLSAYSDYEYVRNAILNGAFDYLLKPCKIADVSQLFDKIIALKESQLIGKASVKMKNVFLSLIQGQAIDDEELKEIHRIRLLIVGSLDDNIEIVAGVTGIELYYARGMKNSMFVHENKILLFITNPEEDLIQEIINIRHYARKMYDKKMPVKCSLHDFDLNVECFAEEYSRSCDALEFITFYNYDNVIDYATYADIINENRDKKAPFRTVNSAEIRNAIIDTDKERLDTLIKASLNKLYTKPLYITPRGYKAYIIFELIQLRQEISKYSSSVDDNNDKYDMVQFINSTGSLVELHEVVLQHIRDIFNIFDNNKGFPKFVTNAIRYIEKNYMTDITLKDIADEVYLNSWYFSSQFKKHTGMSTVEYLNKVRIEKAKELLDSGDLKIYEVADMVGFGDPAYFSTVFKSLVKKSPSDYVKSLK